VDIEFHYYMTYVIVLKAGLKPTDAYIIAYSSQYVDDNNTIFQINEGKRNAYSNYISQTYNILKPKKELMRIYPIFHFIPGDINDITGDSARRCDGKLHLLNTIPDNENAKRLLRLAFESDNLYRIGIATHMYSDTFAHQNFVGYYEPFNSMKGPLDLVKPDIGHADAGYQPDLPAIQWEDKRLILSHSNIDNKRRFLEATERLFEEYYCYFNPTSTEKVMAAIKDRLIAEIDWAIGDYDITNEERDKRISRYKALIKEDFIDYDKDVWFKEAISKNIGFFKWNYKWKGNYTETHWFKFQEAVKAHQKIAKDIILKPLFEKMELQNL